MLVNGSPTLLGLSMHYRPLVQYQTPGSNPNNKQRHGPMGGILCSVSRQDTKLQSYHIDHCKPLWWVPAYSNHDKSAIPRDVSTE